MTEDFKKIRELAIDYLKNELRYSEYLVNYYDSAWRRIWAYMVANNIDKYSEIVEKSFLDSVIKSKHRKDFSSIKKYCFNGSKMLTEFCETGQMSIPTSPCKPPRCYDGEIGNLILEFIKHIEDVRKRKYHTIRSYRRNLFNFSEFCSAERVKTIDEIDLGFLIRFLHQVDTSYPSVIGMVISNLRMFFSYLFEIGKIQYDLSRKIPRYRRVSQPKVPATYTKMEITQLIKSIDRSTAGGKRNYAIVLLAAKLGLRASDISRLRIDDIDWDLNRIVISQLKTGRDIQLPLSADIGNAIIEYLKYGRKESNERVLFLKLRPPYSRFPTSNVVTHVVQRAFINAGIDIKGRRFGPHALRHSLSSILLEERIALPVISEILGHKSTETTKFYLRIDFNSLKQCSVEVPAVAENFYIQKNGRFYI